MCHHQIVYFCVTYQLVTDRSFPNYFGKYSCSQKMLLKFIFLCVIYLTTFDQSEGNFDNFIRKDEVKSINLYKDHDNEDTQLKCLGDAILCRKYAASNVICKSAVARSNDLMWNCRAFEKSWHRNNIYFKDIKVECEEAPGYEGYVVRGSCKLR